MLLCLWQVDGLLNHLKLVEQTFHLSSRADGDATEFAFDFLMEFDCCSFNSTGSLAFRILVNHDFTICCGGCYDGLIERKASGNTRRPLMASAELHASPSTSPRIPVERSVDPSDESIPQSKVSGKLEGYSKREAYAWEQIDIFSKGKHYLCRRPRKDSPVTLPTAS